MKWIDNDRIGSMADVGFTCTIRMCDTLYEIIDWYQEDGVGSYLLVGTGCHGAWTLVSICTLRNQWVIAPIEYSYLKQRELPTVKRSTAMTGASSFAGNRICQVKSRPNN